MSKLTCVHHLALTVTDVDRSVPWYVRVLDFEEVDRREDPHTGVRKVVLRAPGDGFAIVLVQHSRVERPAFDERRTGLDHVAFKVGSRAELQQWEQRLAEYGVTFTPAAPSLIAPDSEVVVFRDPDGIQLEVWADRQ
ncbi:glyoxalase [Prauserella marina]|uniref:Glyoxylase I family protein n=1 Tax=Prauserella marina TaxID=530584 RepID=A0A222VXM6_9PSEU|nr:VOC family protein [Prauserella marina]ASR38664.1 glyoxalase [Prauserella marina]PWV81997.1 glyoxylase I family protein [Prauserella marina]SDD17044.1 glyoxylase I family protein [Prauserella marina]